MRRAYPKLVAILAVVGIIVAGELTWVHYKVHTDPGHRSLCSISEGLDCDAVAASPSATVLGVPNALWAMLTYALLLWLALRARRLEREGETGADEHSPFPAAPRTWLFWASLAIGAYTAWLIGVSATALGTFCLFCAVLWLVNAILVASALAAGRAAAPLAGLFRELRAVRRRPGAFLAVVLPLAAVVAAFVVFVPLAYPDASARLSDAVRLPPDAIPADTPVRGPATAPHRIVSISDYRCPYCRRANEALEKVRRLAPERVAVIHIHYPLEGACNPALDRAFHPGACRAAFAAECARAQGRFWDMHDALFEHAPDWSDDQPLRLAADLGLDAEKFSACLASDAPRAAVERNVAVGNRLQIPGTPTIYIDGREYSGPVTAPAVLDVLESLDAK